ncbi:hypothetical protein KFE80_09705 [bacterium SCSIO 12696]|nr:hypothetical protein KFE80_09705 [bacterium SCSIO 12696]
MINIKILVASILSGLLCPEVAPACERTLQSYGAVGDGVTDDTFALNAAFSDVCDLDGEWLTYVTTSELRIENDIHVKNFELRLSELACTTECYPSLSAVGTDILTKYGGTVSLKNVTVNRGANLANGRSPDSTAAILISGVTSGLLEDVSVTGDGIGSGIRVVDSDNVELNGGLIHDMKFSSETPLDASGEHERLQGILVQRSTNVRILGTKIERLHSTDDGGVTYLPFQTDGITVSGTDGLFILSVAVESVGEGIDLTGNLTIPGGSGLVGNRNFEIAHSSVFDAHSWGFKFANTARHGLVRDSTAVRSGYAGFVFSGPSNSNTIGAEATQNIIADNCLAKDTGYNSSWPAAYGFLVLKNDNFFSSYPKKIVIRNSVAKDDQAIPTMNYGFFSQNPINVVNNVDSYHHIIDGASGFDSAAYTTSTIEAHHQNILGCAVKDTSLEWWFEKGAFGGWDEARLVADLNDLLNRHDFGSCQ